MKPVFLLLFTTLSATAATIQLDIPRDASAEQLSYATGIVEPVIQKAGHKLSIRKKRGNNLPPESYQLKHSGKKIRITAADGSGAIYAMLNLAEQLELGVEPEALKEGTHTPRFEFRAIKFNIPWASSWMDGSVEQHQETCRDLEFWTDFLDMMVENRLNTLTLWSLHPWHLMVRTPEYPEMSSLSDDELAVWHEFWTQLFALADERGIETYLVNANMFVSPAFSKAHDDLAKWSQKWERSGVGTDDPLVVDYTRATIREVLAQYPGLTGLGITLGERMGGLSPDDRRDWLEQAVLAGVRDAGRPVKFLYRSPLSADRNSEGSTDVINDRATRSQVESLEEPFMSPVYVEFMFNGSHGYASPELHRVHGGELSDAYFDPEPKNFKAVWTINNDDFFQLRWGQTDFVRSFIENNSQGHTGGAIIGSDIFIPALDTMSKEGPWRTWKWQFERQWLLYAIWGRLLYDSETPDATFAKMFEDRYPGCDGEQLLKAWGLASSIPLEMAKFRQGYVTGSLYVEAFGDWKDRGEEIELFNINEFLSHPVLDPGYINIRDFVRGGPMVRQGKFTPFNVVKKLQDTVMELDVLLTDLQEGLSPDNPLAVELADIEAWTNYGKYFGEKLKAGVALESGRFRNSRIHLFKARAGLNRAVGFWKDYADSAARFNKESFLFHTREPMSLKAMVPQVENDVALVAEYYPQDPYWEQLYCSGQPHARHEAAFINCDGKLYLLGGRRINPVDQLDPATRDWQAMAAPPIELHHFQAVVRDKEILILGAMTGSFPNEKPVPNVYIFNPSTNTWSVGPEIPENRRRGAAGIVQYDGKVYMVGGIRNGHNGDYVPWLDRWDPQTGEWEILPDAPNARDHFQAAVISGKIYAAGGRRTSGETNELFSLTVPEVDAYDISSGDWETVSELPTPRAGTSTIVLNGYLVVAGGESDSQTKAFHEVEAYNPETGVWADWPFLNEGRHGTGLAVVNGKLFTSSGCGRRGGSPELTTTEVLTVGKSALVK